MKKRAIVIILITFSSMSLFAQRYKDIFPQIVNMDRENSFEILDAFIQKNLDHPNANLRLALIYIDRYKSADAIREYDKAVALAEQAKTRLFKSKILVTSKEFQKNEDYYIGLIEPGKMPSFTEITMLIDTESSKVNEFLSKLPPIYKEFTRSVEQYDQAVKSYADIVGRYTSLKELYLLYNDSLRLQLNGLRVNYDSTKIYFDNYLQLRQGYAINTVKQSYTEVPIKIYRMDGLVTQINFLQPEIKLWDYASWIDSVNTVMAVTIEQLRKDLYENEQKLRQAVAAAEKNNDSETFTVVRADKALKFNLLKYDYKNAIVPLLNYYEFKQQFIYDMKRAVYFDTAYISSERRLAYYNDMMYSAKQGDSIIMQFNARFNKQQLLRHKEFVEDVFGGAEKMKAYMTAERNLVRQAFLKQVTNIKQEILLGSQADSPGRNIKFKGYTIPLQINNRPGEQLAPRMVKTQILKTSADESLYIAGQVITDSKRKNQEIVVVKLSPQQKPVWIKNIDLAIDSAGVDANHALGDVALSSEGIALIVHSVSFDSSRVINTLLHYTDKGELKLAKRLNTSFYPRAIKFIEASNMFVLTFFGDQQVMDTGVSSTLAVVAVNGLGADTWHFDYTLSGDCISTISTTGGLLIGGNYSAIKNKNGRTFAKSTGTNAYVISLSLTGELKDVLCLASDADYSINTIYKVNDNNINLLGARDEQIIIDDQLQKIYSSVILQ